MTDNDPNHAAELKKVIDRLHSSVVDYRNGLRPRRATATEVADAAWALLCHLQIAVGVDGEHPNRIRVTLHGLDIYVDRQGSMRCVEFGRDEMPGLLAVDSELADVTAPDEIAEAQAVQRKPADTQHGGLPTPAGLETLKAVAAMGGEVNDFARQPGINSRTFDRLQRDGFLEKIADCEACGAPDVDVFAPGHQCLRPLPVKHGNKCWGRMRMTDRGWQSIGLDGPDGDRAGS